MADRNLTPEQQAELDAQIASKEKPSSEGPGFLRSFLVGVGDVMSGGRGAPAVRDFQTQAASKNEAAQKKYEQAVADLKERALKNAQLQWEDPASDLSQAESNKTATQVFKFGQSILQQHPDLLQNWTPETAQQLVGQRSGKDIQSDNQGILTSVLNYTSGQIAQKNKQQENELRRQELGAARDANRELRAEGLAFRQKEANENQRSRISTEYAKDIKPLRDREDQIANTRKAFDEVKAGNRAALGPVQSLLARVIAGEKGVLTEQDVQRNGGSRALADRAKQALVLWEKGEMTKENINFFQKLIDGADRAVKEGVDRHTERFVNRQKKVYTDLGENDIRDVIGVTGPEADQEQVTTSSGFKLKVKGQ